MPDIIKQLITDHDKVRTLFDEWSNYPKETCEKLERELGIHTELEETVLYPEAEEFDKDKVNHSLEEHQEAKRLLSELASDYTNVGVFRQLKEAVLHHMAEEEESFFPEIRQRLTQNKLTRLGKKNIECKEELLAKY